ncbi:MAG TPA: NAD-dependent epimerase/dehydratase family protein [Baekduia sp.]|nr:NAD-dependent epimerase/dehydratase family protein [Baekduia sp.]
MTATLVTGGSGLIGGAVVRALIARGERVVLLQRGSDPAPDGCRAVRGDVADGALLLRIASEERVSTVFHLAAQTIVGTAERDPTATYATNIMGTTAVLEAARQAGARRVVVAGSVTAYGAQDTSPLTEDMALHPTSPYDVSKAAADLVARSYWPTFGLPVATTRFANVYGPGDRNASRLVPELLAAARAQRPPRLRSDGTPERDFLHVDDAAAAYLAIADALDDDGAGARGEAFNAGGGHPVSVRDVVATLETVLGRPLGAVYEGGEHDGTSRYADISKIARVCGWRPRISLEEGLRRTLAAPAG